VELIQEIAETHRQLGLSDDEVLDLYRTMLIARRVDDRLWALNRQGRVPFVVSASGHEATQIAAAAALDRDNDWILPYYRDVGVALQWGMTPKELFLGAMSKAADPNSGGRQMPNHWSMRSKRMYSHSSPIATQYPHATGIAYALKQQGSDAVVAVFGGEGSTSEGDWSEAMNFAGIHHLPVVFVIENNGYAISVPVSEEVAGQIAERAAGYDIAACYVDGNDLLAVYKVMKEAVQHARDGKGPTLIEAHTYRYYAHTSDDDDKLYRTREEVEYWRRRDPLAILHQYLVEARLLTEFDEIEIDTEVDELVAVSVKEAEASPAPTDAFSNVYAAPITPHAATTEPEQLGEGEPTNLITAVNRTLHEIMAARSDVVIFGEDVADPKGGVFKASVGLTDAFGKSRSFNTPLAESLIIGAGVGMSAAGLRPIAEIQFADFIHPAFDQIASEAARMCYRTNGDWNCPLVIRVPYGGGIHGALYHSQSIEAFYAHIPGLKVVVPSTPADAKGLLWAAIEDPDPVMVLEPKKLYRLAKGILPTGEHIVPLGKAAIRRNGEDLTILAYGAMAHFAVEAGEVLAGEGVSAEVIDLRSLKPLDWATIEASLAKTGKILIVHEDNEFVGYGAELAAQVADKGFDYLDAPVKRYCTPDVPAFPFATELEAQVYPSVAGIVEHARKLAAY
jgi:2-oxoisovalerate dehydrogenase E1 component